MMDNNRFDDFIRNKVGNKHFEYNEAHWKGAETLISEAEKGGKGGFYLTGTALLIMLVGSISLAIHLNQGTESMIAKELSTEQSTGMNALAADESNTKEVLASLEDEESKRDEVSIQSSDKKTSQNSFADKSNLEKGSLFLQDLKANEGQQKNSLRSDEGQSLALDNSRAEGVDNHETLSIKANQSTIQISTKQTTNDLNDKSESLKAIKKESQVGEELNSSRSEIQSIGNVQEKVETSVLIDVKEASRNSIAKRGNENSPTKLKDKMTAPESLGKGTSTATKNGESHISQDERTSPASTASLREVANGDESKTKFTGNLENAETSANSIQKGNSSIENETASSQTVSDNSKVEINKESERAEIASEKSKNLKTDSSEKLASSKVVNEKEASPNDKTETDHQIRTVESGSNDAGKTDLVESAENNSKSFKPEEANKKSSRKLMKKIVAVSKTVGNGLGVYAGFNYLQAWEINSLTDGLNFSPTIGFVSNYQLNRRTEFEFGLSYLWRSGVSALKETEGTDFDFGYRSVHTSYEINNLNYFDIPFILRYNLDRKRIHAVQVGVVFSQLASVNRRITVRENNSLGAAKSEISKELFQAEGFRSNDVAVTFGYMLNISRKIGLSIDMRMGLMDNTDDVYFDLKEYDRNFGISTGIKILPFRE